MHLRCSAPRISRSGSTVLRLRFLHDLLELGCVVSQVGYLRQPDVYDFRRLSKLLRLIFSQLTFGLLFPRNGYLVHLNEIRILEMHGGVKTNCPEFRGTPQ